MILKKFTRSIAFALKGIAYAFSSQFNMRFHVVTACVVIAAAIFIGISPIEWCIIFLCIGSVISAELINTSIETHVDLSTPMKHEKAGQTKDLAAAAVLVTGVISAIIGSIIFIPKILQLL